MVELTPEEIQQCRDEAEREVGLQVAVVEKVHVGYYTRRVLTPYLPPATIVDGQPMMTETVFVPCHIPRYEKRVVWRHVDELEFDDGAPDK